MSAEQRVTEFIAAFNRMDISGACAMLAEDVVYHNIPMEPIHGRQAAEAFLSGMPGLSSIDWEVLNSAASGDTVLNERVDRFRFEDGRSMDIQVMGVFKVVNDQIVEWRDYFDSKALG